MMTWGGNALRVKVRPGPAGLWKDASIKREVYAAAPLLITGGRAPTYPHVLDTGRWRALWGPV
jgi:hypothetical protein